MSAAVNAGERVTRARRPRTGKRLVLARGLRLPLEATTAAEASPPLPPSPVPDPEHAGEETPVAEASAPHAEPGDGLRLKSGARRMLWVLLRYDRPLTRSQLASLAVVSKAGTLSEYLSALRTQGLIDEPDGMITLTAQGRGEAERTLTGPRDPYTPEQVAELHAPKLKAGARRMLDVLMRASEQGFTRKELAGLAGVSAGGTLSEYLSALRTRGLLEEHHRRVYAGAVLYLANHQG